MSGLVGAVGEGWGRVGWRAELAGGWGRVGLFIRSNFLHLIILKYERSEVGTICADAGGSGHSQHAIRISEPVYFTTTE